jgi:hypothetical protein
MLRFLPMQNSPVNTAAASMAVFFLLASVPAVFAEPAPAARTTVEANPDGDFGVSADDLFEGAEIIETSNLMAAPSSDARDLFGGTLSAVEPGHVLGANENISAGWSVTFATARDVTIGGFNLFLADDAEGARGAREFHLYRDDKLVASGSAEVPYSAVYGSNNIKASVIFDAPVTGKNWRLEVIGPTGLGVRALELDAVTPSNSSN